MATNFIEQRLENLEKRLAQLERERIEDARVETEANPEIRNGVKRPREGTKCRQVWDAMDKLFAEGETPTSKLMRQLALVVNWNPNNATAELSGWRKFHGHPTERAA